MFEIITKTILDFRKKVLKFCVQICVHSRPLMYICDHKVRIFVKIKDKKTSSLCINTKKNVQNIRSVEVTNK